MKDLLIVSRQVPYADVEVVALRVQALRQVAVLIGWACTDCETSKAEKRPYSANVEILYNNR